MADEEQQGGDATDDALDALGSMLHGGSGAAEPESAEGDGVDLDAADLGALALSSRPRTSEAHDEEHRLDLSRGLDRAPQATAPTASSDASAAGLDVDAGDTAPEPVRSSATSPRDALATPTSATPAEGADSSSRSSSTDARPRGGLWLGVCVGFAAGFVSAALVFREAAGGEPSAPLAQAAPGETVPVAPAQPAAVGAVAVPQPLAPANAAPPQGGHVGASPTPAAASPAVAAEAPLGPAKREPASSSTPPARASSGAAATPAASASRSATGADVGDGDTSEGERTLAAAFDAPSKAAPVAAGEERDMDQLLDQAFEDPSSRRARKELADLSGQALAPTPTREQVNEAMAVLLPAIRGCAMGQSGLATASIVVSSEGKVASVSVAGAPFAGAASGRCMEGVIRKARFPRFSQPTFRVKFPFAIK